MGASRSRRLGTYAISESFVVIQGTGRRERRCGFSCVTCADLSVRDPSCFCLSEATQLADVMGSGAVVKRRGVVVYAAREAAA